MTVIEWNKLDLKIRNSESFFGFRGNILEFISPSEKGGVFYNNPKEIQLLTRLSFGLGHLRERKFIHNFQDIFNSISNCGEDIETSCITTFFTIHPIPMKD